jgi:hypothetical protein
LPRLRISAIIPESLSLPQRISLRGNRDQVDGFTGLQGNENNDNQKILFWKWGVKSNLPPQNYLHFWIMIGDFGLKERILRGKNKNLTSGRSPYLPWNFPASSSNLIPSPTPPPKIVMMVIDY